MSLDPPPGAAEPADEPLPPSGRISGELVLDQAEIDAAVGFRPRPPRPVGTGVRAMLDGGAVPREPLPVLATVFEGLAERLSLTLRELFGMEVETSLRSLSAVRYGAFVDDVILPSHLAVFRAEGLGGSGVVALGPDLARLVLDGLLGAAREFNGARIAVRPFTPIETAILARFVETVLADAALAFDAVGLSVAFTLDRVEADPRLAVVARAAEAVHVAELALEVDGRSAALQLVLPAAALEPVRARLRESFVHSEAGSGEPWSHHLATAIWGAATISEAVLHETRLPLGRVLDLAVGDTLMFDMKPSDLVEVRCGGVPLARGRIGRVDGRIAVQVVEQLRPPGLSDGEPGPA